MVIEAERPLSKGPRIRKAVRELMHEKGYDPAFLSQRPLGRGVLHKVYLYTSPDGKREVIKFPRNRNLQYDHGEQENIRLVNEYFSKFAVPTQFHGSADSYFLAMDYVDGKPISERDITLPSGQAVRNELEELVECNRRLIREEGLSLDFIGSTWVRDVATRRSQRDVRLSSIFLVNGEDTPQLRITDTDLVTVGRRIGSSRFDRLKGRIIYRGNRQLVKSFFTIDIAP